MLVVRFSISELIVSDQNPEQMVSRLAQCLVLPETPLALWGYILYMAGSFWNAFPLLGGQSTASATSADEPRQLE
jgi:carbon starvation protein CstA